VLRRVSGDGIIGEWRRNAAGERIATGGAVLGEVYGRGQADVK